MPCPSKSPLFTDFCDPKKREVFVPLKWETQIHRRVSRPDTIKPGIFHFKAYRVAPADLRGVILIFDPSAHTPEFKKPEQFEYKQIKSLYDRFCEQTRSCEAQPVTILLWQRLYRHQIAIINDMMFIMLQTENGPLFLLPLAEDMQTAVNIIISYCRKKGIKPRFLASQGGLFDRFSKCGISGYTLSSFRDDYEYIYNTSDLINLSGKKYHSKRNHITAFNKKYNWSYESLSEDLLPEIFSLADKWSEHSISIGEDPQSINSENSAIKRVLPRYKELGIMGGAIKVDGEAVAFSFASAINSTTADVHVEKALPDFRDAYPIINQQLAIHELSRFKYLNREDDMGLEGLRKAKLSYHPAVLLEKYFIDFC